MLPRLKVRFICEIQKYCGGVKYEKIQNFIDEIKTIFNLRYISSQ